jgi:hypothetical protein
MQLPATATKIVDGAIRENSGSLQAGGSGSIPITSTNLTNAWTLDREHYGSLLEGIEDSHVEVREIAFVPRGHGEAVNASRGGYHGVLA